MQDAFQFLALLRIREDQVAQSAPVELALRRQHAGDRSGSPLARVPAAPRADHEPRRLVRIDHRNPKLLKIAARPCFCRLQCRR